MFADVERVDVCFSMAVRYVTAEVLLQVGSALTVV